MIRLVYPPKRPQPFSLFTGWARPSLRLVAVGHSPSHAKRCALPQRRAEMRAAREQSHSAGRRPKTGVCATRCGPSFLGFLELDLNG